MKRLFLVVALAIILPACSAIPQLIQFDDQGAAATVQITTQLMRHWEINSEFWKVQVGKKLDTEDFYKLKTSWNALDALHAEIGGNAPTEKQAGQILSWYLKWLAEGGDKLKDVILPWVLKYAAQLGLKF